MKNEEGGENINEIRIGEKSNMDKWGMKNEKIGNATK